MRASLLVLFAAAMPATLVNPAAAQPAGAPAPPPAAAAPGPPTAEPPPEPEPSGFFAKYKRYYDKKLDELLAYEYAWGTTASLPEGVLKLRYEANPARAHQFFDGDGNRVRLLPSIELDDMPEAGETLTIFPNINGRGVGHTFQIAYGITDPLDVFVELPFTKVKSKLDLQGEITDANGDTRRVDSLTKAAIIEDIEANGRPRPGERYDGSLDMGDLMAGASWNFHRSEHFSAMSVSKVTFPTGGDSIADPDNDITFLLGPEIDRGMGAWMLNFTHAFDVRPIDELTFNLELSTTYRFAYERPSPQWLPITACSRVPPSDPRRAQLCPNALDPAYDPQADAEAREFFPDLTNLASTYRVDPALSFEVTTGFIVEPGIPIPIQVAYNFQYQEAPTIRAKSRTPEEEVAGAEFERLVDQLAMYEPSRLHNIGAGLQLPLFPAYVPLAVTLQGTWAIAGRNTIVLERNVSIALEGFFPVGDLWMD